MSYTVGILPYDLGGIYSARLPTLAGVLNVPALGPPSTAASNPTPFSITFAPPPNPPGSPGTLLITDPSGPGDYFRSGQITTWPAQPVTVVAGSDVVPLSYGDLSAGITTPMNIDIPGGIVFVIGLFTGFWFTPFKITLTSVNLGPSPTPGAIRARFSGVISFVRIFVPSRTDVTGSVDMTLAPSGNAADPNRIVNVSTSNLSLSTGFTTPLSMPALSLLAPLFSGELSGRLMTEVNQAFLDKAATVRPKIPLPPSGIPLFTAMATLSARRIHALPSGVLLHAVLSELVALPPPVPGGVIAAPGAETRLVVTIDPPPEMDVALTYVVKVQRESDLAAVQDATVAISTFMPVTGASLGVTGQTTTQGLVALDVTLRTRAKPSMDPTHAGGWDITWPAITVTKVGFHTYTQDLSGA